MKKIKKYLRFFIFPIDTFFRILYITTTFNKTNAPLAQSVEQRTVNPCVAGSNPAGGALKA